MSSAAAKAYARVATTTSSPRTTTPPAEKSVSRSLIDVSLQGSPVVHNQLSPALGDYPRPLEHCQETTGGLPGGSGQLGQLSHDRPHGLGRALHPGRRTQAADPGHHVTEPGVDLGRLPELPGRFLGPPHCP